ncbi:MAG: DNA mismatch repair protein MutS [Thermogemmatispora sp.]|uniref:DNA mismatch repair protein MutS n=1 Tax=Thermogemmatispora sp. TaxID=1968838 RepID=UPI001D7D564A|nr:DNA mismatch repair protein MutS [Thermogemmatispora sp.]MBX5450591.1 DNA mismatch repair protein MutS [Thermogemmatispora sp.]
MLFEEYERGQQSNHSPIRSQYLAIKERYPDTILFFRMGDFYEMFDEDAEIVARELEIALTRRDFGRGEKAPMAGVPHQAAESYIARLVSKGYRVAVCEQVSDPALSRGLVEREVTRIVTPGTVVEPAMLAAKRNNFLAAVVMGRNAVGVSYVDITTGEFATTQIATGEPELTLQQEIARIAPAEVLVEAHYGQQGSRKRRWLAAVMSEKPVPRLGNNGDPDGAAMLLGDQEDGLDADDDEDFAPLARLFKGLAGHVTPYDARFFSEADARHRLQAHFGVASLEGFGCEKLPLAIRAAGAVLAYVQETQKEIVPQLTALETYSTANFMILDPHTRRNLELFESGRSGSLKGSLLWVLDRTRTPMGGRLLRRWLSQPLLDIEALRQRQEVIAELLAAPLLRARLGEILKKIGDIERLINRVRQRIASPRELVALASSLRGAAEIRSDLLSAEEEESVLCNLPSLAALLQRLTDNADVIALIERAIVPEPPATISEGGIIRSGFNDELDQLRAISQDGQRWLERLEQRERARTGISSLKVGYNKNTGYFIEVSNAHKQRVPADYQRRQTLTNSERFVTPELKEYEATILNARERINKLESELFAQIRAEIATQAAERVLTTAHALAEIDVYLSLAEVAARNNYCRPELNDGDTIRIIAGRHPVVEQAQPDVPFVPNDTELSNHEAQILIITGPNMAGKSTYLRQVALITLMAQIGSYVPAQAATIGIVDRIFTRIGAQDDLATGQSTFMVEMVETANILHHATPRSLVILDEIGRGTSTYDGLAIARAVVEYLHNNKRCGARTLFATHYHELVEVARVLPRIRCFNVAVSEEEGRIVFLRKIVPGGADRSYGVHVAELAGIPRPVIHRAQEILAELERKGEAQARRKAMKDMTMPLGWQMTLFAAESHPILEELKNLDIESLTPIEAISKLYELQQRARREG